MKDDDANFPIELNDRLITFLQKVIIFGVKILAILMTIVILWTVGEVVFVIYQQASRPPYFLLTNIEDILGIFGAFLIVLIAIEIFLNIILYLKKDIMHLKLVVATALMAIARKVIIIDYDTVPTPHLYGIGVVIIALGIAYWLIKGDKNISKKTNLPDLKEK
jgi:uncharacterized membrane protein (DUF373 family)